MRNMRNYFAQLLDLKVSLLIRDETTVIEKLP